MSVSKWHNLSCPKCKGEKFTPVFNMIWQSGMGNTTRPAGHLCVGCNEMVDAAVMISKARRSEVEEKIKELEQQVEHG